MTTITADPSSLITYFQTESRRKSAHRSARHCAKLQFVVYTKSTDWNASMAFPCQKAEEAVSAALTAGGASTNPFIRLAHLLGQNIVPIPGNPRQPTFEIGIDQPRSTMRIEGEERAYRGWATLTVYAFAERKADILSEEALRGKITEAGIDNAAIAKVLCDAVAGAERERTSVRRREANKQRAEHLVHHLADLAIAEAKSIVRYSQRLAALSAELDAEKKVQVEALIERVRETGIKDHEGHPFDARLVEVACAHVLKAASDAGGPFRSTHSYVSDEDVADID